jgi:hypothetical protein
MNSRVAKRTPIGTISQGRMSYRQLSALVLRGITPELTGAGARSAQGTNIGHQNREAMANVGVRVERFVRLGRVVEVGGVTYAFHGCTLERR